MGDYCDEIPAHLLYAEEPAVSDPAPVVAAEERKSRAGSIAGSVKGDDDEVDEPDEKDKSDKEDDEQQDKVKQKIEEKQTKEIDKIKKLYEQNFISRFLKIIDVFTSVALINQDCLGIVIKVSTPSELSTLIELLPFSAPRHGQIILRIIDNLIRSGVPGEIFEESIKRMDDQKSIHFQILERKTQAHFDSKFLQFLYNFAHKIRSSIFTDSKFESHNGYLLLKSIQNILRYVLNKSIQKKWKDQTQAIVDQLISDPAQFKHEEREIIISWIDGADF